MLDSQCSIEHSTLNIERYRCSRFTNDRYQKSFPGLLGLAAIIRVQQPLTKTQILRSDLD